MVLQLILGLTLMILGYFLMPKDPEPKQKIQQIESPKSESGVLIPWLFGDKWIKSYNFLGWWDKQYKQKEDDSGSKK